MRVLPAGDLIPGHLDPTRAAAVDWTERFAAPPPESRRLGGGSVGEGLRERYDELLDTEEAVLGKIRELRGLGLRPVRDLPGGGRLLRELRRIDRERSHLVGRWIDEALSPLPGIRAKPIPWALFSLLLRIRIEDLPGLDVKLSRLEGSPTWKEALDLELFGLTENGGR